MCGWMCAGCSAAFQSSFTGSSAAGVRGAGLVLVGAGSGSGRAFFGVVTGVWRGWCRILPLSSGVIFFGGSSARVVGWG